MATKKKTNTRDAPVIDYTPRTNNAVYLAKAIGEALTLPETDRTRLQVYLRKLIEVIEQSGGTEVVANPTLAGTEDELLGLQVGETKYKVRTNYYLHNITIVHEDDGVYCTFSLINSDGNYTKSSFLSSTFVQGLIAREAKINAYFGIMDGPEPLLIIPMHIKIKTGGIITLYYCDDTGYTSQDIDGYYELTDEAQFII